MNVQDFTYDLWMAHTSPNERNEMYVEFIRAQAAKSETIICVLFGLQLWDSNTYIGVHKFVELANELSPAYKLTQVVVDSAGPSHSGRALAIFMLWSAV